MQKPLKFGIKCWQHAIYIINKSWISTWICLRNRPKFIAIFKDLWYVTHMEKHYFFIWKSPRICFRNESFVFLRKVIQIWNNMNMSQQWQNFILGWSNSWVKVIFSAKIFGMCYQEIKCLGFTNHNNFKYVHQLNFWGWGDALFQ